MWGCKWPVATHGITFQIYSVVIKTDYFYRLLAHTPGDQIRERKKLFIDGKQQPE
jgi:hypothetical protein